MPVPACPTCTNAHDPAIKCRFPATSSAAQFRLSVILADIEEADAKLETLRAQEGEARGIMVAALGMLAYRASEAQYRIEERQWQGLREQGGDLRKAIETADNARAAHASILGHIGTVEDEKAESQTVFDAMKAGA